jgi:PAS domain S-box-containing protein
MLNSVGAALGRAWRATWITRSFTVKINFLLGLGLAILISVAVLAQRSIVDMVETDRLDNAVREQVGMVQAFLANLRRAEAAQRKYLITSSTGDISAYRSARAQVDKDLEVLRGLDVDPEHRRRLRDLVEVTAERVARLDQVIEVRRTQGTAAATAMVRSPLSVELNERIQSDVGQFEEYALRSMRLQREEMTAGAENVSFLILWSAALAGVLLLWAMVAIHRHQSARYAAERAVRASEMQLRLITNAVPALIGYVDADGRLQFHNQAFEQWFGLSAAELQGRPLRELLGSETYRSIEPYVDRVLHGSATDFKFALARKGGEPMDVSAQLVPRREETGAVGGYYALATDITALTEVQRLKSQFVATVSHELRTPLTSISGSLGLLQGGVVGALPEAAGELVTIAKESCERLVRLVNDILDSEKMESGKMQFASDVFDLAGVIERSLKETEGFASAHVVQLRFERQPGAVAVRADRDRLVQVVTNLLSNACKFSPSGGTVEVAMQRSGAAARVSVCDRGPGVPGEFRARLFERFSQVDSSNLRRQGGTGLGLSICKGIIERLGGTMGYAPRDGGGSVFYFELPVWRENGPS